MQVLLARVDCLRRRGREGYAETEAAFGAAQSLLTSYFPDYVDQQLLFTSYAADCALALGGSSEDARAVWNAALKTPAARWAGECAVAQNPLLCPEEGAS